MMPRPTQKKKALWKTKCKQKLARNAAVHYHLESITKGQKVLMAFKPIAENVSTKWQKRHLSKEKLLSNNPLSGYTPRELLAELKRRGYKWERMYYTQEVKYENI